MDRYPPEHPPEECDFYQGLRLVTRAYWDNSDGVGLDFDLYLRHGWYAPSRINFALPLAMHSTRPTVHAVSPFTIRSLTYSDGAPRVLM